MYQRLNEDGGHLFFKFKSVRKIREHIACDDIHAHAAMLQGPKEVLHHFFLA
jgi:hypothetical protein